MTNDQFDVAIIGGGIAGLSVALRLPEYVRVALFTKGQLGESNTRYAQGGLAVALGADDRPELHLQDTLAAGAGLCDEEAVRVLVGQASDAVRWLISLGVQFDRDRSAQYFGVEGAQVERSQPLLLVPIMVSGCTATSVELRNAWQRACAQFRTAQSPTDYIPVSGMGADPLLINAAQTQRPGRGSGRRGDGHRRAPALAAVDHLDPVAGRPRGLARRPHRRKGRP